MEPNKAWIASADHHENRMIPKTGATSTFAKMESGTKFQNTHKLIGSVKTVADTVGTSTERTVSGNGENARSSDGVKTRIQRVANTDNANPASYKMPNGEAKASMTQAKNNSRNGTEF